MHPAPPATDCYSHFWGAAIGMNLNQSIDPVTQNPTDPILYDTAAKGVNPGQNSFTFDQLATERWTTGGNTSSGNSLIKIKWPIVTNPAQTTPFDFCVANVRALTD